jgi:hypothetical protein
MSSTPAVFVAPLTQSRTLKQLVILRMGANPEPEQSVFAGLDREGPVAQSDSH